MFFKVFNVALQ